MGVPDGPNATSLLALAFAAITAALVQWFERRKVKREEPAEQTGQGEARVIAATFTERGQMDRLTSALTSMERSVIASSECVGELVILLRAEAQRRHDDAVVRQALRDRGIIDP